MINYSFSLTYNSITTDLGSTYGNPSFEPKGWDAFESEIKRDFNSHGVLYKFTANDLMLGFPGVGRTVLEDAFQSEGYDTQVLLTVTQQLTNTSTPETIFEGYANMENRDYSQDYFTVDFENSTFQQKVMNRLKTKFTFSSNIDLDGNVMSGSLTQQTSDWNTIRLNDIYDAELSNADEDIVVASTDFKGATLTAPGTVTQYTDWGYDVEKITSLNVINIEGANATTYPDGYFGDDGPVNIWTVEFGGDANVKGTVIFDISLTAIRSGTPGTPFEDVDLAYQLTLEHFGADEVLKNSYNLGSDTENVSNPSDVFVNFDFTNQKIDYDQDIVVEAGDYVFLVFETSATANDGVPNFALDTAVSLYSNKAAVVSTLNTYLTITELVESTTLEVNSWLVYDVMDRAVQAISGAPGNFYSEFFGNTENGYASDGCGALNVLTNGYQLRGLTNELTLSLKEILDWAQARYNIGYGFELDSGSYRLRVEQMEHFYSGGQILDLGSPIDEKEKNSYREETFDGLVFNRCEIGYATYSEEIEFNNIFEDFLTEAVYSFPISMVEGDYTKISPFIASNDVIQNTFDARRDLGKSWKYDENIFIVAVIRDGGDFIPENDQNFDSTTGLDDPATAYNIRHAPVYMFLEQALTLNSSMFGKALTEEYLNTSALINTAFSALFSNSESCRLGDEPRQTRSATGNIAIEDNFSGKRLFKPYTGSGTYALSSDQLQEIIDAMENNNSDSSKNLGYLTLQDNDGNSVNVYPLDIPWNPTKNIARVNGIVRATTNLP